jgi:hypothetical protein
MRARQAECSAIHRNYGLRASESLKEFAGLSFQYADRNFAYGDRLASVPALVGTVKARHAGFHDCVDTEEMFTRLIRRFQKPKRLPPRD